MAQVTRALLEQSERWIHRRVERISFKDDQVAHHRISADFTLPAGVRAVDRIDGKDVYIAPLFLMVKGYRTPPCEGRRPRRRFILFGERRSDPGMQPIPFAPYADIGFTDQDGRRIPLMTRRQSSLLAKTVLLEAAEQALGAPATGKLRDRISAIPDRSWLDLGSILAWLLTDEPAGNDDPRAALRADDAFSELAYTLASHSIIACLLTDPPRRRLLYKLSYDERLNPGFSARKGRLRRSLGWEPQEYTVPLNQIGAAASYHVEIEAPRELSISTASLFGKRYRWFGDLLNHGDRDYAIQQVEQDSSQSKIYIPEPLPECRVGMASVKLWVQRRGFLASALIMSCVVMGMLIIAAFAAPIVAQDNQSDSGSGAAALLLLPALFVAVSIAWPGEHAITAKMLPLARAALVADAILPIFAVFLLISTRRYEASAQRASGDFSVWHLQLDSPSPVWIALAALSVPFVVLFAISNFAPRRHGETVYRVGSR